ncbi:MAG: helix-turn-helix domain-containing protein [Saprospirales bacterium]|nr:MAG: helix-turn-helix domain-containing protein [Saprospirales bacterium]
MMNSKFIGNKIAEERKRKNLSQADLAQKISISPQAVGKWERGESMPDITKLNRLAEIFGLDLNYFSDTFHEKELEDTAVNPPKGPTTEALPSEHKEGRSMGLGRDLSEGNWLDADFSGLKNLKEKISGSNLRACKFLETELTNLIFKGNSIEKCDFSGSDWRNSRIQGSTLVNNTFAACSLIDTEFKKCDISQSDFSRANFEGAEIISCDFESNKIEGVLWKLSLFKNSDISEIIFEGTIENCSFENCSFKRVEFRNATIINSFFKNNIKLNRVKFSDCKVDKLTYAFLKNGNANLHGISLIE